MQNQLKFKIRQSDAKMMETDVLEGFVAEINDFLEECSFYARRPRFIWNLLDNLDTFNAVIKSRSN